MSFLATAWPALVSMAAFIAAWIFLWWLRRATLKTGAQQEQNRQQTEMLDDVQKANDARDRLRRDAGYAGRVRARFTRKT
jgi:hypothetical protein